MAGTLPLHLFGSDGYGKPGPGDGGEADPVALAPFMLALAMANIGIPASLTVTAMLGGIAIAMVALILPLQRAAQVAHDSE